MAENGPPEPEKEGREGKEENVMESTGSALASETSKQDEGGRPHAGMMTDAATETGTPVSDSNDQKSVLSTVVVSVTKDDDNANRTPEQDEKAAEEPMDASPATQEPDKSVAVAKNDEKDSTEMKPGEKIPTEDQADEKNNGSKADTTCMDAKGGEKTDQASTDTAEATAGEGSKDVTKGEISAIATDPVEGPPKDKVDMLQNLLQHNSNRDGGSVQARASQTTTVTPCSDSTTLDDPQPQTTTSHVLGKSAKVLIRDDRKTAPFLKHHVDHHATERKAPEAKKGAPTNVDHPAAESKASGLQKQAVPSKSQSVGPKTAPVQTSQKSSLQKVNMAKTVAKPERQVLAQVEDEMDWGTTFSRPRRPLGHMAKTVYRDAGRGILPGKESKAKASTAEKLPEPDTSPKSEEDGAKKQKSSTKLRAGWKRIAAKTVLRTNPEWRQSDSFQKFLAAKGTSSADQTSIEEVNQFIDFRYEKDREKALRKEREEESRRKALESEKRKSTNLGSASKKRPAQPAPSKSGGKKARKATDAVARAARTSASTPRKRAKEIWSGRPDEPLEGGWPDGWTKKIFRRASGETKGDTDRYWYSPQSRKFRSMVEVKRFFALLLKMKGDEEAAWTKFKGR